MFTTSTSFFPLQREGGSFARYDGFGLCGKADGGVAFGDTMEKYLFPHAIWILSAGIFCNSAIRTNSTNFTDPLQLEIGDIVAFEEISVPRPYSAILATTVTSWRRALYSRRIIGPGRYIGYLIVKPPAPDPDILFEDIVQDPLSAGLLSGLRSKFGRAFVIPSPTIGCQREKRFHFIAVSNLAS